MRPRICLHLWIWVTFYMDLFYGEFFTLYHGIQHHFSAGFGKILWLELVPSIFSKSKFIRGCSFSSPSPMTNDKMCAYHDIMAADGRHHAAWPTPQKTKMFSENQWLQDVFAMEIVSFFWGHFWGHSQHLLNQSFTPRALSRGHRRTIRWVGIYQQEPLDVARLSCFFLHGNPGNHRKTTPICYMYGRFTYMNVWIVCSM